jgi:putative chitinase
MITREQLIKIMPHAKPRADIWLQPLNDAMSEFGIDTQRRVAAFLAQVAHESAELRYTREIDSGSAYDTGKLAERLGNTPEADGDGQRYKGRGLIQITGRFNYRQASLELFKDATTLLEHPELLEQPELAARSAAWFWWSNGLNTVADCPNSFQTITRRINGGLNGYAQRVAYFSAAQGVLA